MADNFQQSPLHPVALTIAGSDSGGGAGIQADLRAFSSFGVYGTTAITALTAQNPHGVTGIQGTEPELLRKQIRAVAEVFSLGAVKTGMLFSAELIAVVAEELKSLTIPIVADPVMLATSGAHLLQEDAVSALKEQLLPQVTLITPNIPEAEVLAGRSMGTETNVCDIAGELSAIFACAVLVKGGHSKENQATDLLACGDGIWQISSPVVQAVSTHGTGCSLSSACAAVMASNPGISLLEAVCQAKAYTLGALRCGVRTGIESWAMWPAPELPITEIKTVQLR